MQNSALPFRFSEDENSVAETAISADKLPLLIADWLADCESGQISPRTIELRQVLFGRLVKYLRAAGAQSCGVHELRAFFAALVNARTGKPLRPVTADTYRRNFSAFFNWLIAEGELRQSPILRVRKPPTKKASSNRSRKSRSKRS
jgi:hypothetical protein